ncbi:MAG: acyl transferase [Flavobacteriales bacterium]|nr:acyl transferase [Flavobacteriales bacterium]
MVIPDKLRERIFTVSEADFEDLAMNIFRYQATVNPVYRRYIELLGRHPDDIGSLRDIPFLPVNLFRGHEVICTPKRAEVVFESSTTTGQHPSRHHVPDVDLYRESCLRSFGQFVGQPSQFVILALLPSYLERGHSSLVYMVQTIMESGSQPESAFYKDDLEAVASALQQMEANGQPCLLIGVTYALLDLAERFPFALSTTMVMETGGMKGRREELVRAEVHDRLKTAFSIAQVWSEYGMTELLSQAYSVKDGLFQTPSWMQVRMRDVTDPFAEVPDGRVGAINIIDLANLYTCSFIATDDIGKWHTDRQAFEVLGRLDAAEIRGCSLLYPGL